VTAYLAERGVDTSGVDLSPVPVRWTTYQWRPEQLVRLVEQAGLRLTAELRLPAEGPIGPTVVLVAERER
jgi:hypothetical protein